MSGPIVPPLEVTEVDGAPDGRPITKIVVSNGDLSISGRTATIDTTGSGGTPGGSDTQVQYNNAGAFGGSADFTFTGIGGTDPTLTITNSASDAATITQKTLTFDGGTALPTITTTTGDDGLLIQTGTHGSSGPYILLDAVPVPSDLLIKNAEEDGTINIVTDDGAGDITVNANGDLNLYGDSDSVVLRHQSGGSVYTTTTTDEDAILGITSVGTGTPRLDIQSPSNRVWVLCDENKKLKVMGGAGGDTFIFDVSSATGGITWPDGTEQITAASGVSFPLEAPDGSAVAPSYTFASQTGTGSYYHSTNKIGWATGGGLRMTLDNNHHLKEINRIVNDGGSWSYPSYTFDGDEDTGMGREDTNAIFFGTGGSARLTIGSDGTVDFINSKIEIDGDIGDDGQVLTSTGSAVAWEDLPAGGGDSNYNVPAVALGAPANFDKWNIATQWQTATYAALNLSSEYQFFSPFMAPVTGAPTACSIYINTNSTADSLYVGFYSATNGAPATMLGYATIDTSSTGGARVTSFTEASAGSLTFTRGEQVWYSINKDGTDTINIASCNSAYQPSTSPDNVVNTTNEDQVNIESTAATTDPPADVAVTAIQGSGGGGDVRAWVWLEF